MIGVSVIIPTYNRAHVLTRAINSVINQTYIPNQVIVVDDGSLDNTQDLLKEFKRDTLNKFKGEILYLSQKNQGVSSARNLGIKQSSGDWVAFLDSDDYWLPNKLERQIEEITKNSHLKKNHNLIHTDEVWVRNGKRVNACKHHQKYGGWIYQNCLPLCCISPSSVLIKKEVFDHVGLFDESLPACEDYDLWLKICHKYQVLYIPERLIVKTGGHEDQLSKTFWGMDRFRVKALMNAIKNLPLSIEEKNVTLAVLTRKLKILAIGCQKHERFEQANLYRNLYEGYSGKQLSHLNFLSQSSSKGRCLKEIRNKK